MQRKVEKHLLAWKSSSSRKPLLLNGARQVGKTYSVLEFGRQYYKNILYIDFAAQGDIAAIFDADITPQVLIPQLEARLKTKVEPGHTLIFFDEVQRCERALTSLKYFHERDSAQHIVAAGSLLGVTLGREQQSFPVGQVDMLPLYPLDFEEYLWAAGEQQLASLIREHFHNKYVQEYIQAAGDGGAGLATSSASAEYIQAAGDGGRRTDAIGQPGRDAGGRDSAFGLHDYALKLLYRYLFCGGLPEAVLAETGGANEQKLRAIQHNICDAYIADMTKYAAPLDAARILAVWRGVPEQLAKENHKFQYSTIAPSARAHAFEAAIHWLQTAGLLSLCYRVSEGQAPLGAFAQHDFFKLYLLDVGLLGAQYGSEPADLLPDSNKASRFRGGMVENYIMQQLKAAGIEPYYWGISSKSEVDFLVRNRQGAVIPLEVKSGGNVTARSLEAYRKSYAPPYLLRASTKNFGISSGVVSLPLYFAFVLDQL